jgi:hypothetical protein
VFHDALTLRSAYPDGTSFIQGFGLQVNVLLQTAKQVFNGALTLRSAYPDGTSFIQGLGSQCCCKPLNSWFNGTFTLRSAYPDRTSFIQGFGLQVNVLLQTAK